MTAVSKEGAVLQIKLPPRLDKSNAAAVASEIEAQADPAINDIRIDAGELRYVSADGLDVILDLKKKYENVTVTHARMGICDTLEAYGFHFFIAIEKQYRFVSVKDCEIVGQGGHGTIYKTGEDTIVKVYRDNCSLSTIENERRYARNAFLNGIPTAIAYDVVQTEYGYGVMFEMLDGTTLGRYIAKHPEELEPCSERFADLLYRLNTTKADPDLYKDFHDVYLARAEYAKKYISDKDAETLKRIIRSIPRGGEMIHGDYHPNNVMIGSSGELMLIDMADISRGNGFFDIGGSFLLMDHIARIPLLRRLVKKVTGLTPKDSLKMWDILMRRYYKTDDEKTLALYRARFRAFGKLRIAGSLGMESGRPKIVTRLMGVYVKHIIVKKADRLIEIFSAMNEGQP